MQSRVLTFVFVAFFLLVLPGLAFALEPKDIRENQSYLSTEELNLRDSPPKRTFYILGNVTGLVKKDEKVLVKEKRVVLRTFYWLHVERANPTTNEPKDGWVLGGKKGEQAPWEEVASHTVALGNSSFTWQSESKKFDQLSGDITSLYQTLLSRGELPLQKYVDQEGKTVERIMRDKKLFFGKYFPVELDQLICSLNRSVCSEASAERAKDATTAEKPKPPIWSNKIGDTLVLPAIDFHPYVVPKPYDKKRGESIEDIAVSKCQGCETFDAECQQFIRNLNPRKPKLFETSFTGTIIVPTLALRAKITVAEPHKAAVQKKLDANVVPNIRIKPKSSPDEEPLYVKQKPVFSLIRHPFTTNMPLPSTYQVTVAVFDSWVDGEHCDFDAETEDSIDAHNKTEGPNEKRAPCGSDGLANIIYDHGTHVVGIIGAKLNKVGTVGINPQAKVVAFEIHSQELRDPVSANKAADMMMTALRSHSVGIFNFSFEYTADKSTADPIEDRIKVLQHNILFVTSAGNDKADMSKLCSVRPACLSQSLRNVISVVALNLSEDTPQLWTTADGRSGSNYGKVFDIGAPGENVLSTIHNDQYGTLSGTSQAAPIVAGACSLLLAKDSKLMPVQIKHRLIYTSDFFENLNDKILGGRLNIERAMAFEDDLVTLKDGTLLKGRVDKAGFTVYHKTFGAASQSPAVGLSDVVRLRFNARSGTYTMMYISGDSRAELKKGINVDVLRRRKKIRMQILDGSKREFEVTDIDDYVSALKSYD